VGGPAGRGGGRTRAKAARVAQQVAHEEMDEEQLEGRREVEQEGEEEEEGAWQGKQQQQQQEEGAWQGVKMPEEVEGVGTGCRSSPQRAVGHRKTAGVGQALRALWTLDPARRGFGVGRQPAGGGAVAEELAEAEVAAGTEEERPPPCAGPGSVGDTSLWLAAAVPVVHPIGGAQEAELPKDRSVGSGGACLGVEGTAEVR